MVLFVQKFYILAVLLTANQSSELKMQLTAQLQGYYFCSGGAARGHYFCKVHFAEECASLWEKWAAATCQAPQSAVARQVLVSTLAPMCHLVIVMCSSSSPARTSRGTQARHVFSQTMQWSIKRFSAKVWLDYEVHLWTRPPPAQQLRSHNVHMIGFSYASPILLNSLKSSSNTVTLYNWA